MPPFPESARSLERTSETSKLPRESDLDRDHTEHSKSSRVVEERNASLRQSFAEKSGWQPHCRRARYRRRLLDVEVLVLAPVETLVLCSACNNLQAKNGLYR